MLNIVVVFPKKEIVLKMKNVLIKNGFDVSAVCVTGAQAIQAVERLEAGVVVCGIRFADMIYNELKECIPDTFEMVVIASNAQWQEYGDDDVIYLPLPLKAYDLVDTVSDLLTDIHRFTPPVKAFSFFRCDKTDASLPPPADGATAQSSPQTPARPRLFAPPAASPAPVALSAIGPAHN